MRESGRAGFDSLGHRLIDWPSSPVELNHKGDTFHNEWQAFRTRKDNKVPLEVTHIYEEPGEYRVVVKVIDILGNDTTKTVKVRVR